MKLLQGSISFTNILLYQIVFATFISKKSKLGRSFSTSRRAVSSFSFSNRENETDPERSQLRTNHKCN